MRYFIVKLTSLLLCCLIKSSEYELCFILSVDCTNKIRQNDYFNTFIPCGELIDCYLAYVLEMRLLRPFYNPIPVVETAQWSRETTLVKVIWFFYI